MLGGIGTFLGMALVLFVYFF